MKTTILLTIPFLIFNVEFANAQVQMDKPIELTGADGERMLSNLETPVNGTDAANKAYVDAAVAASGGSGPTMISNESASDAANFGDAVRYCKNLNEGGYADWHLPTFQELVSVISQGGATVSNETSSNYVWTAFSDAWDSFNAQYRLMGYRFSDGATRRNWNNTASRVRCVR